jgi:plastocyanin domain-containing protein
MKKIIVMISVICGISLASASSVKSTHKDIDLQVTENGFEPHQIDVPPGTDVTLRVTRKTDATCATAIAIPAKKLKKELPLNKTVSIELGKLPNGQLGFACGMGMLKGQILVQ